MDLEFMLKAIVVLGLGRVFWPLWVAAAIWVWRNFLLGWRFERVVLAVRNSQKLKVLGSRKYHDDESRRRYLDAEFVDDIIWDSINSIAYKRGKDGIVRTPRWRGKPKWGSRVIGLWMLFWFSEKPSEFKETIACNWGDGCAESIMKELSLIPNPPKKGVGSAS